MHQQSFWADYKSDLCLDVAETKYVASSSWEELDFFFLTRKEEEGSSSGLFELAS